MKEYLDKNISYMQGLYDKNNLSDSGKIELNLLKEVKKQFDLHVVGCSLPSKDEKLIGNMCLSFRHDFGLLPKLIQDDLRKDCKNWLISYENNRK